jgi:hypothetical protein
MLKAKGKAGHAGVDELGCGAEEPEMRHAFLALGWFETSFESFLEGIHSCSPHFTE